jgi:hypothetical protein
VLRIAHVFPRRASATSEDEFVRVWNRPALIFSTHADYLANDLQPGERPGLG